MHFWFLFINNFLLLLLLINWQASFAFEAVVIVCSSMDDTVTTSK